MGDWMNGVADLLSNGIQKEKLVCGKIMSSILDMLSLKGPTSAEEIQKTWNLKLGREMKQRLGRE